MSSIDNFNLWIRGSTHHQSQGPRRRTMLSTSIHETGRGWSSTVGIRQHFQQSCLGCGLFLGYAKVHCKRYVLLESPLSRCTSMGLQSYSHDLFVDFQKKFPNSIKLSSVGFMSPLSQPEIKHPNYKDVCTGRSGHVEVLYVELNDPKKHFEELIRFFFSFHDPTLKGRQGNDRGFQYSSWIFCGDDEQYEIAKKVRAELQGAIDQRKFTVFGTRTVETRLCDLKKFTAAGAEHQDYLAKNPTGYCNHRLRMQQWYEFEQLEKSMSNDE